MARTRTTVTIDEDLLKAVKLRAAREGLRESEVIERALRDSLLISPLEAIWNSVEQMPADEAMELALEAQREARAERKKKQRREKPDNQAA